MPSSRRAPLADQLPRSQKQSAGRTSASSTPLSIRTTGMRLEEGMAERVREGLGRRIGKFATHVERVSVRFVDINGPKGGVDVECRVKVVLSRLPSIVVAHRDEDARTALDRVGHVAERGVRKALDKAGLSVGRAKGKGGRVTGAKAGTRTAAVEGREEGSLIGRRVGRSTAHLDNVLARRAGGRDAVVDTAQPGVSATDRKAGGGSTAARNVKARAPKATATLEDSAQDRPSRKSTRKSANRVKGASQLTRRATSETRSPSARATRSRR